MPGEKEGTRNRKVSTVPVEADAGPIDTRHLVTLPPMAITEDGSFPEIREFVRDGYRSESPLFFLPVHGLCPYVVGINFPTR
jgi:hypothetical protein